MAPARTIYFVMGLTASVATQSDYREQILGVEAGQREARKSGDRRAYASLVSADFVGVAASGQLLNKTDLLQRFAAEPEAMDDEITARVLADAAIVTGLRKEAPDVRFLHVWHREGGTWKLVLVHDTSVARTASGSGGPSAKPMPTVWPDGGTRDERAVLERQRTLNETFAMRDGDAYARLTADSFVRVGADGRAMSRAEFLAIAGDKSGPPRQDPNHSEFRVRVYRSMATLVYFNRAADFQRVTRVFIREGDGWKQIVTQATVVATRKP